MIERVDLIIKPVTQPQLPGSTLSYSMCAVAVDYDDSAAPATWEEVANYSNAIILSPGQGRTISYVPAVALGAVQTSGTLQSAATRSRQWIDMAYTTIAHYGAKFAVTQSTSTNVNTWYLVCRYHLCFRNSR